MILKYLVFLTPRTLGKVGNWSLSKSRISNGKVIPETKKNIIKNQGFNKSRSDELIKHRIKSDENNDEKSLLQKLSLLNDNQTKLIAQTNPT